MKKLISILLVTLMCSGLVSCESKNDTTASTANKVEAVTKENVYKVGEEAFITDGAGNKMYSLKINSAKVANDFEYKSDFSSAKQVIELNYTYSNIAKSDSLLYIHGQDIQVIDDNGSVAEGSSMFPKLKPQEVGVGINCSVDSYYGLSHESNKIKVSFTSQQYKKTLIFEISVK